MQVSVAVPFSYDATTSQKMILFSVLPLMDSVTFSYDATTSQKMTLLSVLPLLDAVTLYRCCHFKNEPLNNMLSH